MQYQTKWRLFNVDSMVEELSGADQTASTIDLCVASLAFKNFDFVAKRLAFVIECSTRDPLTWLRLVDAATERYWIRGENEGVAVYGATDHCGCIRTYRFNVNHAARAQQWGRDWVMLATEKALYAQLDTPAARAVFDAWHHWTSRSTQKASQLAEGRFKNTAVEHSFIVTSGRGCVVCADPAVAHASTTLGFAAADATLIQLPVCADHLETARSEPSVLTFLEKMFSLSFDLPTLIRSESIPDVMIPTVHQIVADELGGTVGSAEKRSRGWLLKVELPSGWHWLLRVNSLMDYAYMLFKPGDTKAAYRADSAPDHPELPFFPDHEHSKPDRKKDVRTPSFLYGIPLFDLKRLRDMSDQHGAR
ncbi:hypothetical protein [Cupriavidus basilensis]|uniref:hypothetical protein n=1 Tax=Cupriavidus basilensis TaxID=68895 RepID=UPI0005BCF140|nr:hypothetical protein [Cupriavidus basilensis]